MFRFSALSVVLGATLVSSCSSNDLEIDSNNVSTLLLSSFDEGIRYQGRWLKETAQPPKAGWAGSIIETMFSGSSVILDIDPGSSYEYYRVTLNGVPQGEAFRIEPGRSQIKILDNLSSSDVHHLQVFKETNYGGVSSFYGFTIEEGQVHPLPDLPNNKIAFFGDSNMDGTSLYSEKDSGESGAYYAYPAMVGRMLNAQVRIQANGGATLTNNGNNNVANFLSGYEKNESSDNFTTDFIPNVIVINAGANDIYQISSSNKESTMKARYKAVVDKARDIYGNVPHIVLYNGYGWDKDEPANYTKDLEHELGDSNLSVLHYPWTWEQWHGSMVEHGGQARIITDHILSLNLGFEQVKEADVFNGFGEDGNVANGSFEYVAPGEYNAFGWRYVDDGVVRIESENAYDGSFHIRLIENSQVHQGIDATGDFVSGGAEDDIAYQVTAYIKSDNSGQIELSADFEQQDLYKRANKQSQQFMASQDWQLMSASFTAPKGSWKTYFSLKSINGTVEVDAVNVEIIE